MIARNLFNFLLAFFLLSSQAFAQVVYDWRYRTHATDCTSLTDGKDKDMCYEADAQTLYVCKPDEGTSGTCNIASEWKKSSSNSVWGGITGTLSGQTDLQSALDAKVATTRAVNTSSPLSGGGALSSDLTLVIANAAADGATKGAAAFNASDFDASSGVVSIDYANGQASSGSTKGFLTSADWTTFNSKVGTSRSINTTSPLIGGGDLSADRTLSISNAAADGATKGAASFTSADFDASSGNISIDYTNGQAASGSNKGFLTSSDWTAFNSKQSVLTNSAGLAGALSDESGSGVAVFGTSPTIGTPTLTLQDGNGAAPTTDGQIKFDRTAEKLQVGNGSGTEDFVPVGTLTDTKFCTYDLAGKEIDCDSSFTSGDAPSDATYITQTANGTLTSEQALSSLSSGIMRVATTTGVVSSITDSSGLAANISDETGTGALVLATSPALTTPNLGVATATSINKVALTAPATASTITVADGKTLTVNRTMTLTSVGEAGVLTFPNATATIPSTADNLSVFSATSSAELAGVISNETGSGSVVFSTSPTFLTRITAPLILGGTSTTQSLTYQTTSGVGATGADHIFMVGNNGATEAMRILNNGRVGIGTFAPTSVLQAVGTVTATAFVGDGSGLTNVSAGGWSDGGTNVYNTATTDNVGIGTTTPSTTFEIVKQSTKSPLMVSGTATGDGDYLIVNSSGNVGIGTTAATGKLDVRNDEVRVWTGAGTNTSAISSGELYVEGDLEVDGTAILNIATVTNDAYGAGWNSSTAVPTKDALYDKIETLGGAGGGWIDGGPDMYQSTTTDNVGIGTTKPEKALDVIGTVRATQFETTPSNQPRTEFNPILASDTHWIWGMNSDGGNDNDDALYLVEGTDVTSATSRRLYVAPGGNIGVGSLAPTEKLEVIGNVKATSFIGDGSALTGLPSGGGWTDGGTNVYTTATTDKVGIGTTTPTGTFELVKQGSTIPFMVSATASGDGNYLIINSGGAVGIGTTFVTGDALTIRSPAANGVDQSFKIYANGATTSMLLIDEPAAGKARMRIRDTGTAEVTFDTDSGLHSITGNLGIGTTSAQRQFEIVGADADMQMRATSSAECVRTYMINSAGNELSLGKCGSDDANESELWNVNGDMLFSNNNGASIFMYKENGNVGIGTLAPQSLLSTGPAGYMQFMSTSAGAPTAGDCDSNAERGRFTIDTSNNRLYVCNGATRGWDYTALTD